MTYEQIRGTGLANSCPQIEETSRGSIALENGKSYSITGLCLQPTTYFVKEESTNKRREAEFVPVKVMTRYTSSIDAVSGSLKANPDGSLTFKEEDGLDFQAVTVQLPRRRTGSLPVYDQRIGCDHCLRFVEHQHFNRLYRQVSRSVLPDFQLPRSERSRFDHGLR